MKAVENMWFQVNELMTGLKTNIINVNYIVLHGASADNKKQPTLTDNDDGLPKNDWLQEDFQYRDLQSQNVRPTDINYCYGLHLWSCRYP